MGMTEQTVANTGSGEVSVTISCLSCNGSS